MIRYAVVATCNCVNGSVLLWTVLHCRCVTYKVFCVVSRWLAILNIPSRFPSPAVSTNWPFFVDVSLHAQSIKHPFCQLFAVYLLAQNIALTVAYSLLCYLYIIFCNILISGRVGRINSLFGDYIWLCFMIGCAWPYESCGYLDQKLVLHVVNLFKMSSPRF